MDQYAATALLATSAALERDLVSLLVIGLVAASVPLIVGLLRLRIAEVVLLLGFGILFGPHALGWIKIDESVELMNELGLGLLFFLAGYELEQSAIRGRSGRLAASGWLTSLGLSLLVVWGLWQLGVVKDLVGIAIALTTTAMGTLLPVVS